MIGIVSSSLSIGYQKRIDSIPSIYAFEGEGGYYYAVPYKRALVIEYWARKGIVAQETIMYTKNLMGYISRAKELSDSISMALQLDLFNTKNHVVKISADNTLLRRNNAVCEQEKDFLKEDNKRLKKEIAWRDGILGGVVVAVVVAITTSL